MDEAFQHSDLLSPSLGKTQENVVLNGSDDSIHRFHVGRNVVIACQTHSNARDRDSARVQTKLLTEFKDQVNSTLDRPLTAHRDLVAFHAITESVGHLVRVVNRNTRNRVLLKGFDAPLVDIQFAYHNSLLAVLDADYNLYIYSLDDSSWDDLKPLKITDWPKNETSAKPKISWCPYKPEDPSDPSDNCDFLAICTGNEVFTVNLTNITEKYGYSTVSFNEAEEVESAIFKTSVEAENEIVVIRISPDSTALAVVKKNGEVTFYVVDDTGLKFAHNWNPGFKTTLDDLYFLDDISYDDGRDDDSQDGKVDERFWRYCLVAGDEGKRLAIFECRDWKCLATLRIQGFANHSFYLNVDPSSRYVHMLSANKTDLICVELDMNSARPRFASVTQISFCRSVIYLTPYSLEDSGNDTSSYDIDADNSSQDDVCSHYVALTPKTLVQLDVYLEKSSMPISTAETGSGTECEEPRPATQPKDSDGDQELPTVELLLPSTSDMLNVEPSGSRCYNTMDRDELELRFSDITSKLEQMALRAERFEVDRERDVTSSVKHIEQTITTTIREQFLEFENHQLNQITRIIENNSQNLLNAINLLLNEAVSSIQNTVQANHKPVAEAIASRASEKLQEQFAQSMVPSIEGLCVQLFRQMNETFRSGLEQYMNQMRTLHNNTLSAVASASSSKPSPPVSISVDRQALMAMIRSNQIPLAFETVLNQGDQSSLKFLCEHVDPESFFPNHSLSQPVLLSLLHQLSLRLEFDTDLKFRYFEHILEKVVINDPETQALVPNLLMVLNQGLNQIQKSATNQNIRRQARVLSQLVRSLLGQKALSPC